jgi:hypothetical protein
MRESGLSIQTYGVNTQLHGSKKMKKVPLLTTIFFMMLIGVVSGAQLVVDTVGTYDTPQKMMQAADDNFDELYGAFASLAAFESFLTGAGAYASDILGVENEAGLVGLFSNYVDQDVTSGSTPTFVDLPIATSLDGTVANLMTALSDEGTWAATVLGWADASAARTSLGLATTDTPTFAGLTISASATPGWTGNDSNDANGTYEFSFRSSGGNNPISVTFDVEEDDGSYHEYIELDGPDEQINVSKPLVSSSTISDGTVTLAGDGTITGLSAGGLPDNVVDNGMMADNAIANAEMADDAITMNELDDDGNFTDLTGNWTTTGTVTGGTITDGTFSVSSGAVTGATTIAAGTSVSAPLLDAPGDEDLDIGSADVDDVTLITENGSFVFGATATIPVDISIAQDKSITLTDNNTVALDATADGMDDGEYNGITIEGLAFGSTTTAISTVFLSSDGKVDDANATQGTGLYPAFGLAVNAGNDTDAAIILVRGIVRDEDWSGLTVGNFVYLGETAGTVTQTAPSTENDCIQIIGWALSDSEIYFDFSRPYQLVAAAE